MVDSAAVDSAAGLVDITAADSVQAVIEADSKAAVIAVDSNQVDIGAVTAIAGIGADSKAAVTTLGASMAAIETSSPATALAGLSEADSIPALWLIEPRRIESLFGAADRRRHACRE